VHTRKTFALVSVPLAVTLLVAGCRDSVNPVRPEPEALDDPDALELSHGGAHPRIFGTGTLGTGSPTAFGDRQEFDFDVASDLTGRSFFRDWSFVRADGTVGTLTVDADPETAILGFRDGSDACADPGRGAEFDGTGREDDGDYLSFTVAVCDNGPAGSGTDFYRLFVPNGPFLREGFLSSGNIVKEGATPEPGTGDLTITTSTTGGDIPGYTLSATRPDGSSVTVLFGANDTQSFPGQPAGDYRLELTDVPTSCTVVNGTNPRTVTVPGGGSVSTTFEITCEGAPQSGDLTIITSTTGENLPAGYTVAVTGPRFPEGTSAPIGPNDALSAEVTPGDYVVELRDVATNCSVTAPNPRTVPVAAGDADSTTFVVTCTGAAPTTGDLTIITSTTGENIPAGYTLSFSGPGGSGTVAIAANQTQSFPGQPAGDYTLELTDVPTNCSVVNGTNPRTVRVDAGDADTTTFEITCTGTAPPTGDLTITTSTSGDGIPAGYTLNFSGTVGSGTVAFAANQTQSFPGQPAGDYTLELTDVPTHCTVVNGTNPRTVTVPGGGSVSTTFAVTCTALNQPPTANFTFSCNGLTCNFTSTSSDADGSIAAYSWTFGDNTTSTQQNPSHSYAQGGTYTVGLTVTDNRGATATTSRPVTVTAPNQPPTANFTFSCNGLTCSFTSTSSDPDGSISAYLWTFGDNTTSTAQNPSHTYAQGGSYTVTLTVTDNRGATATTSRTVTVTQPNRPPSVNAGADQTVLLGVLYSLSASFTDPDNNGPWSYTINWGDGTSSNGTRTSQGSFSVSHNYLLIGSYTIRVTVRDNLGASGSDTKVLTVLVKIGL